MYVINGSPDGLDVATAQLWTQGSPGIGGSIEFEDSFGASLAAANFGGTRGRSSHRHPGRGCGTIVDAGAVQIIYGSRGGLTANASRIFHQNTRGIRGTSELGDSFGEHLTAGNFDNSHQADLAVSATSEDVGPIQNAGLVNILYSNDSGLDTDGNQIWSQDSTGIEERAEQDDLFGWQLASGDFSGDAADELAIAVKEEQEYPRVGVVHVLRGSPAGLTSAQADLFDMPRNPTNANLFGSSLAAGNFGADAGGIYDDLAITGTYRLEDQEDFPNSQLLPAVHVIYGHLDGLGHSGDEIDLQTWWLTPGTDRGDEYGHFGEDLAAADFGGADDGYADLAIGATGGPDFVSRRGAGGSIYVMYGTASGLTDVDRQAITQTSLNVEAEKQGVLEVISSAQADLTDLANSSVMRLHRCRFFSCRDPRTSDTR